MANQWFRMYSEFVNDPKVQRISEIEQRRFIMVLCIRCSNGDVTLQDSDVAFQLRISDAEWLQTKSVLVDRKLINADNKPIAWEKRQYISDSSTARVLRHRSLKKSKSNCDETLQKHECNAPDTDTDTEKKKKNNNHSVQFLQFWEAWPKNDRKGGKAECWKIWQKKNLDLEIDTILGHIEFCKGSDIWKDAKYISAPSVYLNQSKWDGAEIKKHDAGFDMNEFMKRHK